SKYRISPFFRPPQPSSNTGLINLYEACGAYQPVGNIQKQCASLDELLANTKVSINYQVVITNTTLYHTATGLCYCEVRTKTLMRN
ncbi:MAG TPA: hypothetical protein VFZ42_14945, partial [Chitinophagaceae bacterium]